MKGKSTMKALTTSLVEDELYNIALIGKFIASNKIIRSVMGDVGKVKGTTTFSTLLLVYLYPRYTIKQLSAITNQLSVERSISILLRLNYIRVIGKPRLIVPFQRFKVDKGYVITPAGEAILRKIVSSIVK